MTHKTLLALALGALAGALPREGNAHLNIVATVPDLAALAVEVGGKNVSVRAISLPSQDPHFVDAKPSLVLDLNRADLLLAIGLELETGWLPVLITSARNPRIQVGGPGYVECAQFVKRLEVPTQAVDRSMGDIHPGGNPHYLYDPRAGAAVARGIAHKLGELDPANAGVYQSNLATFLQRLQAARSGWEKRLASYRGTPILGYHRTLAYLADWLGLVEVEYLEPKPGIPPSASHVARVIAVGQQRKVPVLLQESYYPDVTSRLVAQRIAVSLVRLSPGTDFNGGQSYIDHLEANVGQLERGLRAGGAR